MNNGDHELFEAELLKLTPARPPAGLMEKVAACQPGFLRQMPDTVQDAAGPNRFSSAPNLRLSTLNHQPAWWRLLRWLAPAAAVGAAALTLLFWRWSRPESGASGNALAAADKPVLKADDVEFDQQLVASFDAIARLPSGQPVRFRCREWSDEVVLRDSVRGIVIEQRTPRLEVVPVSFETY